MRRSVGLPLVLICGAACAAANAAEPRLAFALPTGLSANTSDDTISGLLDQASTADAIPLNWRSTQVQLTPKARLRISVGNPLTAPGANAPMITRARADSQAYEVSVVRDWPGAVSFETRSFGVNVSPHAAVGVTPAGGLAEAGARLELSHKRDDAAAAGLNALGVTDGVAFGDKGRWYLFAAASGRAVGLNMLHGETGWDRAGWTTDQSSTLVGDAQVGVGWRKGSMQTSLGVLHREVKAQHAYYGYQSKADSVVAVSFAVRPGR